MRTNASSSFIPFLDVLIIDHWSPWWWWWSLSSPPTPSFSLMYRSSTTSVHLWIVRECKDLNLMWPCNRQVHLWINIPICCHHHCFHRDHHHNKKSSTHLHISYFHFVTLQYRMKVPLWISAYLCHHQGNGYINRNFHLIWKEGLFWDELRKWPLDRNWRSWYGVQWKDDGIDEWPKRPQTARGPNEWHGA